MVKRILRDEVFLRGDYDTGYLPEFLTRLDADALIDEISEAAGSGDGAIARESIAIEDSDELKVLAPSTGILYLTPSPNEPAYVGVGDRIATTETLCQLEAFKIFTPVHLGDFNPPDQPPLYEPDRDFQITRINVSGGQQVNAGDLLFVVRPVADD